MSESETGPVTDETRPCGFEWCATPHGAPVHEDDEDHRSEGWSAVITVRASGPAASEDSTEVEVGLLRRRTDSQTWLLIEDGRSVHAEVSLDSARDLLRAIRSDAAVARQLGV